MKILPWLFKGAHEQDRESSTSSPSTIKDKNAKGKDIIILKHHRAYGRSRRRIEGSKKLRLFTFICGKDIPKACFYRTLHFGNMNNTRDFIHSVKIKREELSGRVGIITKKADSAAHVGKKVLPITDASFSTSTERNDQCVTTKTKRDKKKPISRMKELLRWSASAKTDKGGKFNEQKVQRQGNRKAVPAEDDQHRSKSPKISFTWDVEIRPISPSVYSVFSSIASFSENGQAQIAHSPIHILPEKSGHHITCRKENWIITDEFVVLEL
ncbi:hypothetical protein SESBI_09390 [Sesbania bispinosa]|nr:hypothetical protein SESBI_09390 [Sesbania bispinosa]